MKPAIVSLSVRDLHEERLQSWHHSLKRNLVDGVLLDVFLETLSSHKLLHASLADAVSIENLEKFLEGNYKV